MQSRRDHLQAYKFSTNRLVHAVTAGDAGMGDVPFRRSSLGVVIGAIIAALLSGGAVVYGLISPAAATAWRNPGSVIVEKETGTRYLYLNGVLRPTVNYASAMLVAGQNASVQYVTRATLAGIPVGAPIGIPGAPDTVPLATALLPGAWALCLRADGGTVLDLAPAGRTRPAAEHRRILVTSASVNGPAADYVLWGATKYPLADPSVLPALGLGNQPPVSASPQWLATLPTGTALAPAAVPGSGQPGPQVAGHAARIGELFQATAAGVDQFYVLRSDGLAPITRTEAALFTAAPGYAPPTQVSPSAIAAMHASADNSLLGRLPELLSGTTYAPDGTALCALQTSPGGTARTSLVTEDAASLADAPAVLVPTGRGMLVEAPTPAAQAAGALVYLVTDTGKKYLFAASDADSALGYTSSAAQVMPPEIMALIPNGPTLSVAAAQRAVTWASD